VKIWEKIFGPESEVLSPDLNNLAAAYEGLSNYTAAEPLLQRAVRIDEKALGPTARTWRLICIIWQRCCT